MALEGIMLAGAFAAATITALTGSPWLGLLAGLTAGLLVAALHAFCCVTCRADQVVTGTAINILMLGIPPLVSGALFESTGSTPALAQSQTLPNLPIVAAFVAVPVTAFAFQNSLRLAATCGG